MAIHTELGDPTKYILDITLGRLLVFLFLFNTVVLATVRNLFNDVLIFCIARAHVVRGKPVTFRKAPRILRAVGIDKFLTSQGHHLTLAAGLRLLVSLLLIASGALFEQSVNQLHIPTVSPFRTLPEPPTPLAVRNTEVAVLLSPFPTSSVPEADIGDVAAFSDNGTIASNREGSPYRVRTDPRVATLFAASCVSPPHPKLGNVTVFAAALIDPRKTGGGDTPLAADAAASSGRAAELRCLDGAVASARKVVATFQARDDLQTGSRVARIELRRLANERGISGDGVTAVFGATVVDETGTVREGYIAITKRSHFNANVQWSMYGVVRARGEDEVLRVNIPLYLSGQTNATFPCFDRRVSLAYVGNWTFNGALYTCPDGVERPLQREKQEIQSANLHIFPVMAASGTAPNSSASTSTDNSDLLVWLAETDYARFTAASTFSEELDVRVRSRRLYCTAVEGYTIRTTDGGQREAVEVGRWQTILFITSVSVLLLYATMSVVWSLVQQHQWQLKSEIISFEAIIDMFSAADKVSPSQSGSVRNPDILTVGLRAGMQEKDGVQIDVQVLGSVATDEVVRRKVHTPLVGG